MMELRLTPYFPTILASLIVTFFLSPLLISFSRKVRLIDVPGSSSHKTHNLPTPMAGGLVLGISLILLSLWLQWFSSSALNGILLGSLVVFVFGLLDDFIGFGPSKKLIGQIMGTAIIIFFGVRVHLFSNEVINYMLTILWVVGLINAFNFVDSMDGLALGLGGIAAAFFMLVTIESGQQELASLSAGLFGMSLGVYFYNSSPAKAFLGDSGSQLLGFLLATIGVAYNPLDLPKLSSWYVPILVMGLPIFDMVLVVFSRLRRGAPVYRASLDHTYHRLRSLGLESTRAVFSMHLIAIVLGLAAFIALSSGVVIGNTIFGAAVFSGIGLIIFFETRARLTT